MLNGLIALKKQIVWRGIAEATPLSCLCGRPSLPHNFKGNKFMKIHIHTIYAILEICHSQYMYFLLNKVAEQWNNSKFRITILNIGKMWKVVGFLKRLELWCSCGVPAPCHVKSFTQVFLGWSRFEVIPCWTRVDWGEAAPTDWSLLVW